MLTPIGPRPALAVARGARPWGGLAALLACTLLAACNKTAAPQQPAAVTQKANETFAAIAAACTEFLAARQPEVAPVTSATPVPPASANMEDGAAKDGINGGINGASTATWAKTGFSAAQVVAEITPTESAVTPFVGKLVVKDNEARATAPTQAEVQAIILAPAHLLANRTHTFIYSFDGQQWRWQNGQRLNKTPGQNDAMAALTQAEVSASGPKGFAGCLPR
ncbi:hypothetical protein ACDW_23380 [Acidovorax sp. DW039]|uniref:hypothetical protein n=1 Tax=Acidovorax sp. DW039 TaxID=3095606 RepID=UPI00308A48EF|nr:hypothetical protein ACDW_23380 [Acidovorax sp. DW039]